MRSHFIEAVLSAALLFFSSGAWAETQQQESAPPAVSTIDSAGNLDMQIRGASSLKIGGQDTVCTPASRGAFRFNIAKGVFQGCDGKKWISAFDDSIAWY